MKRIKLVVTTLLTTLAVPMLAFAQEGAASSDNSTGARALACGIAIGIAALGGGLGQGKAAAAALEGISRNPNASGQMLTPLILGLAFVESLVILALLVVFLIKP